MKNNTILKAKRRVKRDSGWSKRAVAAVSVFALLGVGFIWQSFAATNPNLKGDLNNDNKVTVADLSILLSNFNTSGDVADLNGDGKVTVADLSILLSNFGKTYSGGSTPTPTPTTPPPPTTPPTPSDPTPTTPPPAQEPHNDVKAASCTGAKPVASQVTGYTIKKCEDFNGSSIPSGWTAYSGGGGNTVYGAGRQASQCKVADGILRQTQQTNGATCGMSSNFGGKYGYWEVKMKAYGGKGAHPVLIVWPDSDKWPEGGELDFFEADIGGKAGVFLHCASSKGGNCYHTTSNVDFGQWHVWGFEWTASNFTGYIDGEKWYTTSDKGPQMPGPGHLTIQLDNLSGRAPSGIAYMDVDWARYYSK